MLQAFVEYLYHAGVEPTSLYQIALLCFIVGLLGILIGTSDKDN